MSPVPPAGWEERAARAVERGRRWDRWIPGILLDSPLSHAGYAFFTAFGFCWGLLWSTGRVSRRGGLWVFRGMPNATFGRGGVCVGGCFLTGAGRIDDRLLAHEATHRDQWRRYGALMPFLYLAAGRDPLRNRFEIEAGLEDGRYVPRR
ncbi:Fe-S oxidoreductase [Microbacterium sp. EYE_5]|uniref:Fe-S oxidoreductase n=1 Tax=unclassified Microbacterium TaxID=2609290 RepID=UPI002003EB8B|nr:MULTISPECIES: Fe-S oxidoreductase [unclassified Microbacterium]MCK6081436.1 Fe-S oxidoreductase [Microbacterium sp. EYE_382]MCK6086706.1 Fe-S oxidoreductase [Microbacterium sp. EYE_384]MCK6123796.1 Fe-S oxidoreductase [Microbacterium sp. EYE_80]MCK6126705.1 Fe-S oxidoreductase [Microbacterium sp. EYE_79]MCK6142391.1 Fe-S oxidoreductase [Microbacterium sp. EYE_39]